MPEKKLIDLYPYRIKGSSPEFLLLKRAKGHVYYGQWRMVGGKVKQGETYWQAALRELKEETSLSPVKFWTIPGVNHFYEQKTDMIHSIPAFAAELHADDTPVLDDEHNEFGWFHLDEALKMVIWPEQKRLLTLTNQLLTADQILEDWIVSTD
ncbi:MAG: NUDIX domain-containing protein [Balneolaceae bacterium]|nr:NUDIX domain-containing protein [Balneolaceae bacterium]